MYDNTLQKLLYKPYLSCKMPEMWSILLCDTVKFAPWLFPKKFRGESVAEAMLESRMEQNYYISGLD